MGRRKAMQNSEEAARDLAKQSQRLYGKLAGIQLQAQYANKNAAAAIAAYAKKSQGAIRAVKTSFGARLNTLTNDVASNARKVEAGFEVLTGVIRSHRTAGALDRKLIRQQTKAMAADMQNKISSAIEKGEARARRIADRARANLARQKRAMLIEISERVEAAADNLFKTIQGSHQKIADNYLSLKAYSVTAGDKLKDYVIKINGLVNEYTGVITAVRARWPMGLGKYLLLKLEESMLGKGVLQVDKVSNHAGNFVFLNGRAVGLSNKLNDFESLAVRMGHYEATLAKLTASLAGKVGKTNMKKPFRAAPPEWPGN